ncbi:MAG: SUMF1/EgtB/PvdO family nonheme iron enzyme [Acidobacteriota bacterium]|nr:SUMF1/EgtB/PvdO family nonheme iron enzyme [Acidobacteriota bacterium]
MIGQTIEQYKIAKTIARTAIAESFLAVHVETGDKYVLKAVNRKLLGIKGFKDRLIADAGRIIQFDHPNVIPLENILESEGGIYTVHQFVEGQSLDRVLQNTAVFPLENLEEITRTALAGIDYAKSQGYVHHFLQPKKLIITGLGEARILDFGNELQIAKEKYRKKDKLVKPAHYFAPERFNKPGLSDIRISIYAVGVIMFEMATGKKPYTEKTYDALAALAAQGSVPDPRRLDPEIGDGLAEVIMQACAVDPGQRFQNVGEFRQAFDSAISMAGRESMLDWDPGVGEAADESYEFGYRDVSGLGGAAAGSGPQQVDLVPDHAFHDSIKTPTPFDNGVKNGVDMAPALEEEVFEHDDKPSDDGFGLGGAEANPDLVSAHEFADDSPTGGGFDFGTPDVMAERDESGFDFGTPEPASDDPNSGFAFGTPDAGTAGDGFAFGTPEPAAAAPEGGFDFGTPEPAADAAGNGFDFGAPEPAADAGAGFDFGAPEPAADAGAGFDFGAPEPAADSPDGFDFGTPDGGADDFGFGGSASGAADGFDFGSSETEGGDDFGFGDAGAGDGFDFGGDANKAEGGLDFGDAGGSDSSAGPAEGEDLFNFGAPETGSADAGGMDDFNFGQPDTESAEDFGFGLGGGDFDFSGGDLDATASAMGNQDGEHSFDTAPDLSGGAPTAGSPAGFDFGSAETPAASDNDGFNFGSTEPPAGADPFGDMGSNDTFGFGDDPSSNNDVFGSLEGDPSADDPFGFGGGQDAPNSSNTFGFGDEPPGGDGFNFGDDPASAGADPFSFGDKPASTGGDPFSFGDEAPQGDAGFGSGDDPSSSPADAFSFGDDDTGGDGFNLEAAPSGDDSFGLGGSENAGMSPAADGFGAPPAAGDSFGFDEGAGADPMAQTFTSEDGNFSFEAVDEETSPSPDAADMQLPGQLPETDAGRGLAESIAGLESEEPAPKVKKPKAQSAKKKKKSQKRRVVRKFDKKILALTGALAALVIFSIYYVFTSRQAGARYKAVEAEVQVLVDEGDFDSALARIDAFLPQTSGSNKKRLNSLRITIEDNRKEVENQVANLIERAKKMESEGRVVEDGKNDALGQYVKVLSMYAGHPEATENITRIKADMMTRVDEMLTARRDLEALGLLGALSTADRGDRQINKKFRDLKERLNTERSSGLQSEIDADYAAGRYKAIVPKLLELKQIDAKSKYVQNMSRMLVNGFEERGRTMISRREFESAEEQYTLALRLDKNNQTIQQGLQELTESKLTFAINQKKKELERAVRSKNFVKQYVLAMELSGLEPGNESANSALNNVHEHINDLNNQAEEERRRGQFKKTADIYKKIYDINGSEQARSEWMKYAQWAPPERMAYIPKSNFLYGNRAAATSSPVRKVFISSFFIDQYEVTNKEFKEFVDANPPWQPGRIPPDMHDGRYLKHWVNGAPKATDLERPVTYVSWHAAKAFAEWKGKRLPTEAEWEKAARGGTEGQNHWWGEFSDAKMAVYEFYREKKPAPVGSFPANKFELYEITGNVNEWVADTYDPQFYSRASDQNPVNDAAGDQRVFRGGSYKSRGRDIAVYLRNKEDPRTCHSTIGFRCAKDASSDEP